MFKQIDKNYDNSVYLMFSQHHLVFFYKLVAKISSKVIYSLSLIINFIQFRKYKTQNSNMKKQNSLQKLYQNSESYLKYNFTLADLSELIPSVKIFTLQTNQIQFNQLQNFTFGTQWYTIKLPKSKDNQKRILYYALLCYIFQISNDQNSQKYQQLLIGHILNKMPLILPCKPYDMLSSWGLSIPLITTNQIKACFTKFIVLLKRKSKNPKMILQQLSTLPQIDFVFMSIFQMYFRKWQLNLEQQVKKIQKDFQIKIEILECGYILNDQYQIQRRFFNENDSYDKFFIKKKDSKNSKIQSALKRKQTTQSVGEIDEEPQKLESEINENLHFQELIDAKFVISVDTEEIQKMQKQVIQQKTIDTIKQSLAVFKPFQRKGKSHHTYEPSPLIDKSLKKGQRKSFFNENIHHYNFVKVAKGLNKQRIKTQSSYAALPVTSNFKKGQFKPWTPKNLGNQKKQIIFMSNKNNESSKSTKTIAYKETKNSLSSSFSRLQHRRHTGGTSILINNLGQKRATLQKLTMNYAESIMQTC